MLHAKYQNSFSDTSLNDDSYTQNMYLFERDKERIFNLKGNLGRGPLYNALHLSIGVLKTKPSGYNLTQHLIRKVLFVNNYI